MAVLLLARGDKEGRDLLRKALEARYGLGVPSIDTLKIEFKGRAHSKVGPLAMWIPLQVTSYFRFTSQARWEFKIQALGLKMNAGTNALDSTAYRKQQKNGHVEVITQPDIIRAARLRLTVAAGMLLTPLAQEYIEVKATGERSFTATHLETQDTVTVALHDDYTVDTVSTRCLNPDQNLQEQLFTFQAVEGQQAINDFMLPRKVRILWENVPSYEVTPVAVENNLPLEDALFRLEATS